MFALFEDTYIGSRYVMNISGTSYSDMKFCIRLISEKFSIPESRIKMCHGPYDIGDIFSFIAEASIRLRHEVK